jgi:hypothetical protein
MAQRRFTAITVTAVLAMATVNVTSIVAPATAVTAPRDLVSLGTPIGLSTVPPLIATHGLSFVAVYTPFPGSTPTATKARMATLVRALPGGTWKAVPGARRGLNLGSWVDLTISVPRAPVAYYRVTTEYGSTDVIPVTSRAAGVAAVLVNWPVFAPASAAEPSPRSKSLGWTIVTDTSAYGRTFVVYLQHHDAKGWHSFTKSTVTVTPRRPVLHLFPTLKASGTWRVYVPALGLSAAKVYGSRT